MSVAPAFRDRLPSRHAGRSMRDPGYRQTSWRAMLRHLAFVLLSFAIWQAINVLIALGVSAVLFILMANARWETVFVELAGLAKHYLDAPAAARLDFRDSVTLGWCAILAAVAICRARTIVDTLNADRKPRP